MANLRTDSPISRRIASAFLDFLKSVEPASGVDSESIEVISECLEEVFGLNSSSSDDRTPPGLLVDLFRSNGANGQHEFRSTYAESSSAPLSMSTLQTTASDNTSEAWRSMVFSLALDSDSRYLSIHATLMTFFSEIFNQLGNYLVEKGEDGQHFIIPPPFLITRAIFHDRSWEASLHEYGAFHLVSGLFLSRQFDLVNIAWKLFLPVSSLAFLEVDLSFVTSKKNSSQLDVRGYIILKSEELTGDNHVGGVLSDELFGQFCGALERIHFFKPTPTGDDDHVQLAKAKRIFDEALVVAIRSGNSITDAKSIAETLKLQGNQAMQSKSYTNAVELYTCAIALCQNNAIYYCNRAAAYTQIHKYSEAIADCKKSIEIEPRYSKAYSRLGMAYYVQGNYSDAINLGYLKALELDPNNNSIRENIRVAEQKLREEFIRMEYDQSTEARNSQDPNDDGNGGAPSFTFGANLPTDFANIFMNMTSNSQRNSERSENAATGGGLNEPEIRGGGNINLNIGENVPEEVSGALRSVMEMLSSSQGPQGNAHRR